MTQKAPEPHGDDWRTWARRLVLHLARTRSTLVQMTGGESAASDGTLMWDRGAGSAVVSSGGAFVHVAMQRSAPASSVGATGDIAGLSTWDGNYTYVCTATYDGVANIWKRTALTSGAW